jgi:serine/threonine protein kinase
MGKLIDNYHLTVEIGAGEFGKVYLAQDVKSQEKFAIK